MIGCVLTLRKIQIYALLVGITLIGFSKYAEASKGDNNITNQLGGKNDTDFKEKNTIKYAALGLINLQMAYYHII